MRGRAGRPRAWYADETGFFGSGYLSEYADLLPRDRTLREVDFLERTVGLERGGRILDLACGHGRHSIELARRGLCVMGLDLSAFFLAEAERASRESGLAIRWVRSDLRRIPFGSSFDAVLSLFTSFGFFGDEGDLEVLREAARVLHDRGVFVLDVPNREWLLRNYRQEESRDMSDGGSVLIERSFDPATGWNRERRCRISRAGDRQELVIEFRLYATDELTGMFERAGFEELQIYGDFDGSALQTESPRSILVARKPGG